MERLERISRPIPEGPKVIWKGVDMTFVISELETLSFSVLLTRYLSY